MKSLSLYPINSGKGSGWGVTLTWTVSDGQRRVSSTLPAEASNRRNDADRNWGCMTDDVGIDIMGRPSRMVGTRTAYILTEPIPIEVAAGLPRARTR